MNIKKCLRIFLSSSLLLTSVAQAGIAVVVSHGSPIPKLSPTVIKRIYLGKIRKIPNTNVIPFPIDQTESSRVRAEFNRKVIRISATDLRSYWAKRIFTGKGGPPKTVHSDAEVISIVSSNKNMIGYISSSNVNSRVKVIYKLG